MRQIIKDKKGFLFLSIILFVGILTIFNYGCYLDQESEQRILFANIKEYMLHLPGDEPALVQEMTDFGVLPISVDEDRDHGMAIYYPAFPVWYLNQYSPYLGSTFFHIYTFLIIFWGMCSLYLLGKELFHSRFLSALTVLLFFLSPRMFAESHYNNKDVVLISLYFTMFYWTFRLMREISWKSVILLAFTGALASNMKIVGIWTFGVLGLYALAYFLISRQLDKKVIVKAVTCILIWLGCYLLLSPASWADMKGFFQYLFHYAVDYDLWHDYVLFGGKMVHQDHTGIPHKYLPVLMLLTTPVIILLLTFLGSLVCLWELLKSRGKQMFTTAGYVFIILVAGAVPLVYAVLAATPVYNGWRHFYFVYASMIIGVGYCCYKLNTFFARFHKQRIFQIAAGIYVFLLAAGIAINYPQEHSYFNFLAGDNVVERYELDYWDMSVRQALEIIRKETSSDATPVSVGALNLPTLWGLNCNWKFLPKAQKERLTVTETWEDADYIIINTTYAFMYSQDAYRYVKENYDFLESISSYGHVICEIYVKNSAE